MKKTTANILILSVIGLLFSACNNQEITSYSYVTKTSNGDTDLLQALIAEEVNKYNNTHTMSASKESTIADFDKLVEKIENEVETNNSKYTIYGDTWVVLNVEWTQENIKTTKLNLEQNTINKVTLRADILQENEIEDPKLTQTYTNKLKNAGFDINESNKYHFYKEFDSMDEAQNELKKLENDSILDFTKAYTYFRNITDINHVGKVYIEYTLEDGRKAPFGAWGYNSPDLGFYKYSKSYRDNYIHTTGSILISNIK